MIESKKLPREIIFNSSMQKKGSSVGSYWAPPLFWSLWITIDSIINGAWRYTLTAETISGGSSFDAQVTFFWEGRRQTRNFGVRGSIVFDVGGRRREGTSNIKVRFCSHSLGQNIRLRVDRNP